MSNILSAKIEVTAPGVEQTFNSVAGGADRAEKSISKLSQQVTKFGGGVAAFKPNLEAMKNAFGFLPPALEKTSNALQKLPQVSNQASLSLLNLGRVAQDAPFGFLGIANNLNPLLESFQRLRATTGTNVAAFKALGSSLLGAGGIGFALSAVSSLLLVFGDRLFGGGKKAKETADALKELIKPIEDIGSAAGAEVEGSIAKVNALSSAVLDQTNSYKERNNALNQLKDINKSYFGDLSVETAALGLLKTRVDEYTQAIINQAVIKSFSEEIGKVAVELVKQEKALKQAADELDKFEKIKAKAKGTIPGTALPVISPEGIKGVIDATDNLNAQTKVVTTLKTQMSDLKEAINQAVDASLKFRPLEETKVKKVKEIKFEFDALKAIFKDLVDIQELFSFRLKEDAKVRFRLRAEFSTENGRSIAGSAFNDFSKQIPAVSAELQKEVDRLTKNNIILKLGAQFTLDMSAADDLIEKQLQDLNKTFRDTAEGVFGSIGETIGEALSGGDIQKGIQGLFSIIASGIQSIGKQFIHIGTLALLAKDAFRKLFANPALSIAVGIALVAAGAALKNSLGGGLQGRAGGGRVNKGQPYIVGEIGREIFVPDTGGTIVPNNRIAAATAPIQGGGFGGTMKVVGELILRGNDLVAALANTNRAQGRLA